MENSKVCLERNLLLLDFSKNTKELKTPRLYETWNWEGDVSVLPYKWVELVKNSSLTAKYQIEDLKDYLKSNYYNNTSFDKKSFFFLTHRSEVAGCFYLKKLDQYSYCIEFLLVNNKKHSDKGVEEGLISLAIKRVNELCEEEKINLNSLYMDFSTSNVDLKKLQEMGFAQQEK